MQIKYNQRVLASLAFAFIIVVIGVPMWWKTTEVYRVPLPYAGISALNNNELRIVSNVGIFTHSADRTNLLIKELNDLFNENEIFQLTFSPINITDDLVKNIKTPALLERNILKHFKLNSGDFMFLEWEKFTEDILVTSERSALISSQTTASQIYKVLTLWIFRETKLRSILKMINSRKHITENDDHSKIYASAAPDPKYEILVSVFNPRPDQQTVKWDVRGAIETYLQPFVNEIGLLSDFVLKSQWKYQVPFEFTKKQIGVNENDYHFALSEDHLPNIITSIEGKLGASITDNLTIHLVVYIPPCDSSPLHIYNINGERASLKNNVDSFLSPKWGGIIIANPKRSECKKWTESQEKAEIYVNSHHVMHIALFLLRRIIDIHVEVPIENANIVPWENVTPRLWEIDSYLRIGSIHLITSATSTLQSLVQLLGGIGNIVINDDVGIWINDAYRYIVLAKHQLQLNNLTLAVEYARNAFTASEKAFFDPSLLALLYFPDDQKYAIYIPLFLPIMIPIILSARSIFKYFRDRKLTGNYKIKAE